MDPSAIGLFIHITGGLGLFVSLGLEWTGLAQIRSATLPEQVSSWLRIIKSSHKVSVVSMLTLVLTGVWSMAEEWGIVAWIVVALVALVLMIALSVVLTNPRMRVIGQAFVTEKKPVSQTFRNLAGQPLLWISIHTRAAIALGIVLVMTAKPDLVLSLLIISVAIVLGLASAIPVLRSMRVHAVPAD